MQMDKARAMQAGSSYLNRPCRTEDEARREIGLDIGPGARNLHLQHAQATVAWLQHLRTMQENAPQSEWGVKWSNTLARRIAALKWLIRQAEASDEHP